MKDGGEPSTEDEREGGGCWPTPEQELLLRAAVLDGGEAADSWRTWLTQHSIDDLDGRAMHVLARIYRNLQSIDPAVPELGRLKGIYRYTWSTNQSALRAMLPVVDALAASNVTAVVLDDLALAAAYYQDYGSRPLSELHLLLPPAQVDAALEILQGLGWQAGVTSLSRSFRGRSAATIWLRGQAQGKLYWQAFDEWTGGEDDGLIWGAIQPVRIQKVAAHTLGPTDQLLRLCGYGVHYDVVPPTQWIVDSMVLLRAAEDAIDWRRVVDIARAAHLTRPVAEALAYLRDRFTDRVPPGVISDLTACPPSPLESAAYKLRLQPPTLQRQLALHWYRHTARSGNSQLLPVAAAFPRYLQAAWNLEHSWEVPVRAVRLAARRYRSK